jgi:hypothetical protein
VEVGLTLELADKPKRIGAVVLDVETPKDVPAEKKEAVRRALEHCPLHETLRNPPRLDVEIV